MRNGKNVSRIESGICAAEGTANSARSTPDDSGGVAEWVGAVPGAPQNAEPGKLRVFYTVANNISRLVLQRR